MLLSWTKVCQQIPSFWLSSEAILHTWSEMVALPFLSFLLGMIKVQVGQVFSEVFSEVFAKIHLRSQTHFLTHRDVKFLNMTWGILALLEFFYLLRASPILSARDRIDRYTYQGLHKKNPSAWSSQKNVCRLALASYFCSLFFVCCSRIQHASCLLDWYSFLPKYELFQVSIVIFCPAVLGNVYLEKLLLEKFGDLEDIWGSADLLTSFLELPLRLVKVQTESKWKP